MKNCINFYLAREQSNRAGGRRYGSLGYSLVEVLVVVTVLAIMSTLAIGVFNGNNALATAAISTSEFIQLTRSTAIANGTYARLYIVTTASGNLSTQNYVSASVWRFQQQDSSGNSYTANQPGAWVQETKWQRLPKGVIFDPNYTPVATDRVSHNILNSSYAPNTYSALGDVSASNTPVMAGTPLQTSGPGNSVVSYMEFDNTGALSSISAGNSGIRLVEGYVDSAGNEHLTHPNGTNPANYAILAVDNLTGRVRILRP